MHIHPTKDAGRSFATRGLSGPVDMLNLLRFRKVADYRHAPALAPRDEISGAEAYRRYMAAVQPLLTAAGGTLLYSGTGGPWLIGPEDEAWDWMLLVRHRDAQAFLGFASDPAYLTVAGHRTAAIHDSRLLPLRQESP